MRNGLRASVESYSIKKLEALYGFSRSVSLLDANKALAKVQACLELGDLDFICDEDRTVVKGYNRDDCLSTAALRDWLEAQRTLLIGQGVEIDRPASQAADASEAVSARQQQINALIARLTPDVPLRHCCANGGTARPLAPGAASRLAPAGREGALVGAFSAG